MAKKATKKTTRKSTPSTHKATKGTAKKSTKKAAPRAKKSSDTFAVIETGGKQYQVSEGDVVTVEKLPAFAKASAGKAGELEPGAKVVFDKVLLIDNGSDTQIGTPYLDGAIVTGELVAEGKGEKVEVIRFKSKSRYLKRAGHRQPYAKVKITSIK